MLADKAAAKIHMGRWLSPDPLGGDITNPQSLNRYAYVNNNPASFTDPTGLHWSQCDADPSLPFCAEDQPPDPSCSMNDTMCQMLWNAMNAGVLGAAGEVLHPRTLIDRGGGGAPANNSPCTAQASAFVSANGAYANQISQGTGVSATNLLGLSALESNFGTSNLATNYNNYFGLTVGSAFKSTTGVYTTSDGRKFGVYPSPGFLTSGLSFAQSFQGRRVAGATDPATFAQRLTTPPLAFNSEPGYASKLILRINQVTACH